MLTITDKSVNIAFRYLTFIFTNLLKKKMFVASSNVSSGAFKIGWDLGQSPRTRRFLVHKAMSVGLQSGQWSTTNVPDIKQHYGKVLWREG